MSCNNNSSGFCAFGSNWWWGHHPDPHPVLERQREWQWLWLRQRLRLLTGLHRKSKNGAVVRQLVFYGSMRPSSS